MISKIDSIKVSERVFDLLSDEIEKLNKDDTNEYELNGYLSTFNNCREQGYYLTLYDRKDFDKGFFYVWVCQDRRSDYILVIIGEQSDKPTMNGMFSEESYKNAKYFKYDEEHKAVEYIIAKIKNHFDLIK